MKTSSGQKEIILNPMLEICRLGLDLKHYCFICNPSTQLVHQVLALALGVNEYKKSVVFGCLNIIELLHASRKPLKVFTSFFPHKYHFITCSIRTAHTNSISDGLYTGECDTGNQ